MYFYIKNIFFINYSITDFLIVGVSPGSVAAPPGSGLREGFPTAGVAGPHGAGPSPALPLAGLLSQHRLLELSRFGLRHYDLAQHMLTQQGAVTKLLGKCI